MKPALIARQSEARIPHSAGFPVEIEARIPFLAVQAGTINPSMEQISSGQTKPLVAGVAFFIFFKKKAKVFMYRFR